MKKFVLFSLIVSCAGICAPAQLNQWEPKPIPTGVVSHIVVDSTSLNAAGNGSRSQILYAAVEDVVYRSSDAAESWTRLGTVRQLFFIQDLVLDPRNSGTLFAGLRGGIYKSTDGGMTWDLLGLETLNVRDIVIDPANSSRIYVATRNSFYRSVDGGQSFTEINQGIDATLIYSITLDPQTPSILYATARERVYKSTNSGTNWNRIGQEIDLPFYTPTVLVDPTDSNRVYVVTREGIYGSGDAGAAWNLLLELRQRSFLPFERVSLAIDPVDPMNLYTNLGFGLLKSSDRGVNWLPMESGLPAARVRTLTLDSQAPGTLYAGTDDSVFQTLDGAENWERRGDGIANANVFNLVFSREGLVAQVPAGIFRSLDLGENWSRSETGFSDQDDLTVDPMERDLLYALSNNSVFRSFDGGRTWQPSHAEPLPGRFPLTTVSVGPSRSLYVAGQEVLRSDDQGETFSLLGTFPDFSFAEDLREDPLDPTRLFAATDAGFNRSEDGGQTWVNRSDGLASPFVLNLAVHPEDTDILYAATANGIHKTVDAGDNWEQIYRPERSGLFWAVELDPLNPDVIHAAGLGFHRSADGGQTWQILENGLVDDFVRMFVFDPIFPSNIHAGLDSNGVFSISLFLLDSVEPAGAAPGELITIRGSGFLAGPVEVWIGGVAVPVLEVLDDGTLIVAVPPIGPGPVDIRLRRETEEGEEVIATGEGDELTVEYGERYLLPQYGFGGGLGSDIVLNNPSPYEEVFVQLNFSNPDGSPAEEVTTDQGLELVIPPLGSQTLAIGSADTINTPTPSGGISGRVVPAGPVFTGSVEVLSTRSISTLIRFGLAGTGLAGVPSALPISAALLPVRRIRGLDTGVAVRNAEDRPNRLFLELKDADGTVLAEAERELGPAARISEFVTQLFPGSVDPGFRGSVCIRSADGRFAAIALELEVGVAMTTLPVAPLETDFQILTAEKRSVPGFVDILQVGFTADAEFAELTLRMRSPIPPEGDSRVDGLLYRISIDLEEPFSSSGEDVDQTLVVSGDSQNRFSGQGVSDFAVEQRSVIFRVPLTAFEGSSRFQLSADTLFLGDTVSSDQTAPITVLLPFRGSPE